MSFSFMRLNHNNVAISAKSSSSMLSPGEDLAIMSLCNHTIFDYGTYGLWAALMTWVKGGRVIMANNYNNVAEKEGVSTYLNL